jgi:hypothetical protein
MRPSFVGGRLSSRHRRPARASGEGVGRAMKAQACGRTKCPSTEPQPAAAARAWDPAAKVREAVGSNAPEARRNRGQAPAPSGLPVALDPPVPAGPRRFPARDRRVRGGGGNHTRGTRSTSTPPECSFSTNARAARDRIGRRRTPPLLQPSSACSVPRAPASALHCGGADATRFSVPRRRHGDRLEVSRQGRGRARRRSP